MDSNSDFVIENGVLTKYNGPGGVLCGAVRQGTEYSL